jgi:hypothetical protein
LRKAGDANVVTDRRVTEADLSEGEGRPVPKAPSSAPPAPVFSGATVNIIRNLKSQEYKVEREIPHSADRGSTIAR